MGCGGSKEDAGGYGGGAGAGAGGVRVRNEQGSSGAGSSGAIGSSSVGIASKGGKKSSFAASNFESAAGEYDYLFKILIVGDSDVGKSSLVARFADDEYVQDNRPTVGVDFKLRTVEVAGRMIKLQLWDTAGQERFRSVTTSYYKGAHGVIVVYDITNEESFDHISSYWKEEVDKYAPENAVWIVVGNKCDLEAKRQVSTEDGQAFAEEIQALFMEASAKEATNVNRAFLSVAESILKLIKSSTH